MNWVPNVALHWHVRRLLHVRKVILDRVWIAELSRVARKDSCRERGRILSRMSPDVRSGSMESHVLSSDVGVFQIEVKGGRIELALILVRQC